MKTRRGASLVELLVIMSACTAILTMSASLIHRAMRTHSQTRAFFDVERNALRLSNQFRQDIHRAADCTVDNNPQEAAFLRIETVDRQIVEYRQENGAIFRTSFKNDQAITRDEFLFPAVANLSLREESSPRRLILSISTPVEESKMAKEQALKTFQSMPTVCQVEAIVGRDRRALKTSNAP